MGEILTEKIKCRTQECGKENNVGHFFRNSLSSKQIYF